MQLKHTMWHAYFYPVHFNTFLLQNRILCKWLVFTQQITITGSAKTGLIAQDRKLDFFTQSQSLINALSNFTVTVDQSKVICFFQAQWQAVQVVWGLDGALANQEMAVCGCTAPWYSTMICAVNFFSYFSQWRLYFLL